MIVATVIGARLGHVFFYEPAEYLKNPIEILYVWEGGLASHGAAIGMAIALWLYQRRTPETTYLWTLDRLVLTVALGGALIRLGNLFNSEIVGEPTELPWGFLFVRAGEGLNSVPRHPAQLYEALWYFATWGILMWMYWSRKGLTRPGLLVGVFMLMVFGFRFVVEFFKEVQVDFERGMALYMGQWLSIPLILVGIYFTATAFRRPMEPYLPKV
jgi:prolipoprotein diacylglyceryl transferase